MSPAIELVRAPVDPLRPWWKDPAEIHLLHAWLVETNRIRTLDESVYFTEKPRKWAPEREEMLREEEMERIADELEAQDDLDRRGAL